MQGDKEKKRSAITSERVGLTVHILIHNSISGALHFPSRSAIAREKSQQGKRPEGGGVVSGGPGAIAISPDGETGRNPLSRLPTAHRRLL